MKKIKPFIYAIILGATFAFFIFNRNEVVSAKAGSIALQLGAFKNEKNALKVKNRLGGEVFESRGIYRVYYSILHDKKNIDFICSYLDSKGISYYKKSIDIDENTFLKSDVFESIIKKQSDENKKIKTNKELIKFYKEVIK